LKAIAGQDPLLASHRESSFAARLPASHESRLKQAGSFDILTTVQHSCDTNQRVTEMETENV